MSNAAEWVDAVIRRLSNVLPHLPNPLGSCNDQLLQDSVECVLNLSEYEFAAVVNGLSILLEELNKTHPPMTADGEVVESYCTVLYCLSQCLAKRGDASLDDEDLHSLQQFFQRITQLCLLSGGETEKISMSACKVLYQLSGLHFYGIFNKIILRVTSVNRISFGSTDSSGGSAGVYTGEQCVIQLIPHLNLNAPRLQQILQVMVTSFKDLKKHKNMFGTIPEILHKSIWNFMREYPSQFNSLLHNDYPSLARSAEKLFTQCEEYADNQKKKSQIWPLQNTLLLLCPHLMETMAFGDTDKSSSPKHKSQPQKNFLTNVMKGLASSNKPLCEASVICGADLFTACTYVSDHSSQIFRYFVTQMQGQLQGLLFSPSSPFLHQPSSLAASVPTFFDLDLMVRCLVAQFRLNHRNCHTFTVCLNSDSPPVFKLAFLQALYAVLNDALAVPWWPSPEVTYLYAPDLRAIFQSVLPILRRYDTSVPTLVHDIKSFLQNPTVAATMLNAKRSQDRKNMVEMIVHYQLIQWLIKLYSLHPPLAFHSESENGCVQECLLLMNGLVSLVQHSAPPHLPLNASELLLKLHEPKNIELWHPHDTMSAFWDISGQVTYSITLKLFSRKTTDPKQLLRWLREILNYRILFLGKHPSEASQGVNCKISQQLYTMLETILLLFLRNTDIEAVQIAMSCFKYLVAEAELVTNPTEPTGVPYAPNIRSYKQLEEASHSLQIGRAAQQKRIRSILKDLVHTPGSALVWEDTYSSWRVSKSLLVSYHPLPHHETPPPDVVKGAESFPRTLMRRVNDSFVRQPNRFHEQQLTEEDLQATLLNWTNMTGFLCSLAGVSTKSSQSYPVLLLPSATSSTGDISTGTTLPRSLDTIEFTPSVQPYKVKRSSSYHGSRPKSVAVPQVRLGNQESIRFSSSGESLSSTDDLGGNTWSSSQTESFINEVIALLSCENETVGVNIRETITELVSGELSPVVYPYLFHCVQEELGRIYQTNQHHLDVTESNTVFVDQVVSILQRIMEGKTEGAFENLGHVKVDQLLLLLVRYVNSLALVEKSLTIKIKLCGLLQAVMVNSRELSFHNEIQFRNSLVEYLTQWVSGELCVADQCTHEDNLRSDLDLCAMKAVGTVLSALPLQPRDIIGDMIEEKGKLFLKHFTTFMNMVHSMNGIEVEKMGQLRKHTVFRHVSALREATIVAMSNMLTANIDSGLTHAIALGYHEDLRTRTSFIEVLTFILKQGAEFNSLADTALADRYNQLLDLVTMDTGEGEHPIMISLINSVPFDNLDELAEVLVVLFDYKNKLPSFLTEILMTEVVALESGRLDTLFRGNTMACKVLSIAFKTFGLYYLQSVLRPLILDLMKTQEYDYEVDPTRLQNHSNLQSNRTRLLQVVTSFYETILNSLPSLPLQLRTVCHILYQVVIGHFPDGGLDTVNSAIFLRFINPAIVSPQSYNLVQGDIPTGVRRALTLISKVLQNLANHVLFRKEAHMEVFNKFLTDNFEKSRQLALSMASMGPYMEGEAVEYIAFLKDAYKYRLHSLLWSNQDRVAAFVASTRAGISVRPLYHTLNTLLAQLGAPNTPKRRTASIAARTALVSSQLEEFLDSMGNECDEKTLRQIKAKEMIYQGGYSKAGNPVFYLIVRKFRGDQLHMSYQLLYHIMVLLRGCTERAFEIVIDLTQTTQHNEPDLELLIKFAAYVPELITNQIYAVYFYNMNMAFKTYAMKLSSAVRIFSHIKGAKKLIMIDSLSKFHEFIEPHELKLPSSTTQFGQDGKDYPGAHYLVFKQHTLRLPSTFTVLPCGFIISLSDRQIIFETPTTLKEIHHISEIREVFTEGKGALAIRLVDEGQLLKVSSSAAENILKELQSTISKWQNQQPSRYLSERKLEPKDVPGTFLNLALLNLGSTEPWLRVAAYRLLCAVKDTFKLELDVHLDDSHDLCIPMNSTKFVLEVSKQLAVNESHLTLEFLSEVVAGFQRYSTASKQMCLAYISPWIPNLSNYLTRTETSRAEHEKLVKIFDLLVSLTISEEEMYPLIQDHVWEKMGKTLLITVLDSFIKGSVAEGVGSCKSKVLSDSAVTLARHYPDIIANEIITRMLKTLIYTRDHPVTTLVQHFLWVELAVLSQFLLTLSFNNCLNVLKNMPDLFYICVMMMGNGQLKVRAAIHGVIVNTIHSILSIPQIIDNDEVMKVITLKLVDFSQPRFYLQFGLQNMKTAAEAVFTHDTQNQSVQSQEQVKDPLNSTCVITVVEHLHEIMLAVREIFPTKEWHLRWQKLARRSAFFYNPALQTRSFLMLGVISSHASSHVITRTLKVMEETVSQHEDDVPLLESIVLCLTRLIPLLEHNTKLVHNLFWVAVGVMELGEPTLYAAALNLLEGCIKTFVSNGELEQQMLVDVVHSTREALLWPLNQLDREVGISFDSDFNFALSALLFKGFSHPLSTIRTYTQELLTTLFFLHSPQNSDALQITENNLAYLTALFPESEILRQQLQDNRTRLSSLIPSVQDREDKEGNPVMYSLLLDTVTIATHKSQILFLHMLSSALIQTQNEQKICLLYEFLANASDVYDDIFPLIHLHLVQHLSETLQSSQNPAIIRAVQKLISTAVKSSNSSILIKHSFISDIGFGGVSQFFRPFPKAGPLYPTQRAAYFQKYLDSLIQELSPTEGNERILSSSSLSSVTEPTSPTRSTSQQRRSLSVDSWKQSSSSREVSPEDDIMEESSDDVITIL